MWIVTKDGPLVAHLDPKDPLAVVVMGTRRAMRVLVRLVPDAALFAHVTLSGVQETVLRVEEWRTVAGTLAAQAGTSDLAAAYPEAWAALFGGGKRC